MLKKTIAKLLVLVFLLPIVSTAASGVTLPSKTQVADKQDEVADVKGYLDKEVYQNGDVGGKSYPVRIVKDYTETKYIVKATILRSLNNLYGNIAKFRPPYSDVNFISPLLKKDYSVALVDTDEFDVDSPTSGPADNSITRETNILGNDILAKSDYWDEAQNKPVITPTDIKETIPSWLAIMGCSKALSINQYSLFFRQSGPTQDIQASKTVFAGALGTPEVMVHGLTYYTDVYVSRTTPEKYWQEALNSSIVTGQLNLEDKKSITIGEFAYYLQQYLYKNGEAVMTPNEEAQLLVAYGRNVPNYLPSQQTEAVKYCLARGIFDGNEHYGDNLTGENMLAFLMRAKDTKSRLTFKTLSIEYNKDLVSKGFGVVDVSSQANKVSNITIQNDKASAKYFDYLIQVDDNTTFKDKKGNAVSGLQIASIYGQAGGIAFKDVDYMGIENGYYRLRVPVSIENQSACKVGADGKKYITLTTSGKNNSPDYINIEVGGGWYVDRNPNGTTRTQHPNFNKEAFSSSDDSGYIDVDRKLGAQKQVNVLNLKDDIIVTAHVSSKEDVKWFGYELNSDKAKENGLTFEESTGTITITLDPKTNPTKYVLNHLTVNSSSDSAVTFPAYMYVGDSNILMVSSSFLKKKEGDCVVTSFNGDANKYLISFPNSSVIIDTKERKAISNQWIKEFDTSDKDKSPLIVRDSSGETFIDYRCVISMSSAYLVTDSQDKKIKSISDEVINTDMVLTDTTIYPVQGDIGDATIKVNALKEIPLENTYDRSNFILYQMIRGGTKNDFLIVFKPKDVQSINPTPEATRKELTEKFGISLGEDEECSIYLLGATASSTEVYSSASTGVIEMKNNIWMYKPPDISAFSVTDYIKGGNSNVCPLPIVTKNGQLMDLNFNVNTSYGYSRISGRTMSNYVKDKLDIKDDLLFNTSGAGYSNSVSLDSGSIDMSSYILAPIALNSTIFDSETLTLENIAKIADVHVLIGSMGMQYKESESITLKDQNKLDLHYGDTLFQVEKDNKTFRKISYGIDGSKGFYLYSNPKASKIVGFQGYKNGKHSLSLGEGMKDMLDWGVIGFLQNIKSWKDFSIFLIAFITYVIPRLLIYDFLAFAALAYIANVRVIEVFCTRVFDVYKVLSFTLCPIEKVDRWRIWGSTFIAIVLLIIMSRGYVDALLLKTYTTVVSLTNY